MIVLPLQATAPFIASAAETGTWVDGDMPQLTLGNQLTTNQAFPSNCTPQTWNYHSYTKPNGQYDPVGRQVPVNICAVQAGFGEYGSSGDTYIKPNTAIAFPVAYSITPNPSTPGFAYTPPTPSSGFSHIALFSSLGSAGKFIEDTYSKRLVYALNPVTEDKFLHTSSGARIVVRGGIFYSSNGAWLATYSSNYGYIRVNTATGEVVRFDTTSLNFGLGFIPNIQLAISDDGNTVILSGQGQWAQAARVYDLTGCTGPAYPVSGSAYGCRNRYLHTGFNQAHPGFRGMFDMRFSSDGKSVRSTVETYANNTSQYYRGTMHIAGYELPPPVTYLALGDSFSSGEGEMDDRYYVANTNTDNPENQCHVSMRSYPYLAAEALGLGSGFHGVACSGAKYEDDYTKAPQYPQNSPPDWLAGTKRQRDFVADAQPDVVTVSMIGNDIDFSNKIKRCVVMTDSCYALLNDRKTAADEINRKFDKLVALYNDIKYTSGGAKVYVLGYPKLFSPTIGCNKFKFGMDVQEQIAANKLASYLNATIKAATEKAGVAYIDVENAFAGKQLCDNGVIAVNGVSKKGTESFHPNPEGHRLLAQSLMAQSNNLELAMPAPNAAAHAPTTASAAYSDFMDGADEGGTFSAATYSDFVNDNLYKGLTYVVENPDQVIFTVNSLLPVWLNSEPTYLGDVTTNEFGEITGEITIPEGIEPGYHTLHIYARDAGGQDVDIYKTVFIGASENDYDGDGVPNDDEQCLIVQPVGVDYDRDGTDDACDVEIGEPPADNTPPAVTGTPGREPNAEGWYNGDVTINWTTIDPEPSSGAPTQPVPTIADQEGVHAYTSDPSCDPLNNCATGSLELKIDKTMPSITHSLGTRPNTDGWHNTDVTVESLCSDNLSGILECSPSTTLSVEGANQVVEGVAQDKAGNVATTSTSINIDKTAPNLGVPSWTSSPKSTLGTATVTVPIADNLSGITEAEYYLGDTDPGQGNGATMQVSDGEILVSFNTDFPTGVYKVTMRAKDKAGNWSLPITDYLVVYDPFGARMTGRRTLVPSLANGDTLPGLIAAGQEDKAKFGFNVRYDKHTSEIHRNSDFQFKYETGTHCNKPAKAQNCHTLELNATSIAWLATQGQNDSTGIFQGTANLEVDGAQSNVIFLLTGLDGELLNATSEDRLSLNIYPEGANPYIHNPIYQVDAEVFRGNIKIRKW